MGLFSRDPDADDDNATSPFEGRGFVLSAIIVGAVVVCGVALLLLGRDSHTPTAGPSQAPTTAVTTEPTDQPTDGPATPDPTQPTTSPTQRPGGVMPCKLPESEEGMIAAPRAVVWDFQNGVLVPRKDDLGPGVTDDDGLQRCFRRSPAGAVFAALTTLAQAGNPEMQLAVVQRRLAPGAGQRKALAEARRLKASPTADIARNEGGSVQYVGYKVVDYTPGRAVLSIAMQLSGNSNGDNFGGVAVTMVWRDGDWKIQLRSDGELGPEPDALVSLNGYVAFRGA
ncbi:MAG TPA: hypothetical protein VEK80_16730 [Kribbellaceae bacterium]|nr:hypothetical protein [Kribbellaceae bacterium]